MRNPNTETPVGKTYAEIDAAKADEVDAANRALAAACNEQARWWSYSVSHSSFELVVGEPAGNYIELFLSACEQIEGPLAWRNQRLKVVWHNDPDGWHFVLLDDSVGFKVTAKSFSWRRNF